MRNIQKYRLLLQTVSLIVIMIALFINIKIVIIFIMISTLLGGTFFCGWVCPFGFMQDIFSKIGDYLGITKKKMPENPQKVLVFLRYVIFIFTILLSFQILIKIVPYNPRTNFMILLTGERISVVATVVILLLELISLLFERPFCNYFCPVGAKYGLMSSLRLFTIKKDKAKCIQCGKCDSSCPMNIKVSQSESLMHPQCINCFKCMSKCPYHTLYYGRKSIKKRTLSIAANIILVLAIVLLLYNPSMGYNSMGAYNFDSIYNSIEAKLKTISDGRYLGISNGFKGIIKTEVIVKDNNIIRIQVLHHQEDKRWFDQANDTITKNIIKRQSLNVDVVTGATYTSRGIIEGVKDALEIEDD